MKTIGDAIMATFLVPIDAVKAAISMLEEIENWGRWESLAKSIGAAPMKIKKNSPVGVLRVRA